MICSRSMANRRSRRARLWSVMTSVHPFAALRASIPQKGQTRLRAGARRPRCFFDPRAGRGREDMTRAGERLSARHHGKGGSYDDHGQISKEWRRQLCGLGGNSGALAWSAAGVVSTYAGHDRERHGHWRVVFGIGRGRLGHHLRGRGFLPIITGATKAGGSKLGAYKTRRAIGKGRSLTLRRGRAPVRSPFAARAAMSGWSRPTPGTGLSRPRPASVLSCWVRG